jgi:hypothetical protein
MSLYELVELAIFSRGSTMCVWERVGHGADFVWVGMLSIHCTENGMKAQRIKSRRNHNPGIYPRLRESSILTIGVYEILTSC